jgi:hypothetical protein
MLSECSRAVVESMTDMGSTGPAAKRESYMDFVAVLLAFIVAVVILSFVGKLLWNGVIVELFSFAKPARNVWQILGLLVFVSLIHP